MRRAGSTAVIAVVLSIANTVGSPAALGQSKRLPDYFAALARTEQFDGAVLVAEKGTVIFERAYGYADLASQRRITPATTFPIASISKTFTAIGILQLAEQGKLAVEDPVRKYLPEFPYPAITLRHLLSHTSGLPPYDEFFDLDHNPGKVFTNAEFLAGMVGNPRVLRYLPGDNGNYDNINYVVLALVLEKVSGMPYRDYIAKAILEPVGMTHTTFEPFCHQLDTTVVRKDAAYPHLKPHRYSPIAIRANTVPFIHQYWCAFRFSGFGDYVSTPRDLLQYGQAVFSGRLLGGAMLERAFTPVKLNDGRVNPRNFGLGWEIEKDTARGRIVYHGGYSFGLSSVLEYDRDRDQTIVVYDIVHNNANAVATATHEILNGRTVLPPRRDLVELYGQTLVTKGPAGARALFERLKRDSTNYSFFESDLNELGYDLMGQPSGYRLPVEHRYSEAVAALGLNTELFPGSANVWDSYGEALLKMGRRDDAIASYRRALTIDPKYQTARRAVDSLTAPP